MTPYRDLTDHEWRCVAPLLPEMQPRTELRGRPLANTRAVLNGVLWVIGHAAPLPVVSNMPSPLQGVARNGHADECDA